MENHERLTSGVLVDNLDLTLRLGLPFQGIQKQENAKGNWLKQDGQEGNWLKQENNYLSLSSEVFSATTSNVLQGFDSPSTLYENANIPIGSILGLNIINSSKETPRKCKDCGSETTPLWRKGPTGPQTLCNACGLRYARFMKKLSYN